MKNTLDDVREILSEFDNVEELTEFLLATGHKGLPHTNSRCAIARWAQAYTGLRIRVTGYQMWIDTPNADAIPPYVASPQVVSQFVDMFDRGLIPELIGL